MISRNLPMQLYTIYTHHYSAMTHPLPLLTPLSVLTIFCVLRTRFTISFYLLTLARLPVLITSLQEC